MIHPRGASGPYQTRPNDWHSLQVPQVCIEISAFNFHASLQNTLKITTWIPFREFKSIIIKPFSFCLYLFQLNFVSRISYQLYLYICFN